MVDPSAVRLSGPLAPHRDGVWTALQAKGYSPLSACNLLRVTAHLSRWLDRRALSTSELSSARLERFFAHRRARGYTQFLTPRCLETVLGHLRAGGVLPPPEAHPADDRWPGPLLRGYEGFLVQERGVQHPQPYLHLAQRFLPACGVRGQEGLGGLSTGEVSRFVLREARSSSVRYAQIKISALRSFLRYLHLRGFCRDLSGAVPPLAGCRSSGLPRGLAPEEVQRLLDGIDRETNVGRRNFAVVLLLVRLGLRAGEVARLRLQDVSWTRGELLVLGKGGSPGRLPLPQDVGDALVAYLQRGRPPSASPGLFLTVHAPTRELTAEAVKGIVRSAGVRAQLAPLGAHRLRHTAATQMLRRGASLAEVAQVLRHRAHETTAIYAKVDRLALRSLARPWPCGGAS